jgi:hypothetical protein
MPRPCRLQPPKKRSPAKKRRTPSELSAERSLSADRQGTFIQFGTAWQRQFFCHPPAHRPARTKIRCPAESPAGKRQEQPVTPRRMPRLQNRRCRRHSSLCAWRQAQKNRAAGAALFSMTGFFRRSGTYGSGSRCCPSRCQPCRN